MKSVRVGRIALRNFERLIKENFSFPQIPLDKDYPGVPVSTVATDLLHVATLLEKQFTLACRHCLSCATEKKSACIQIWQQP